VSREEARVNVDLVVLEPAQANGMAQASDQDAENGKGGGVKKELEKEELDAHRGFVDMFKELEAAGAVVGQAVGDAAHAVADVGKAVGEQMGDATDALATNLNAITTMFNDDVKSEGIKGAQSKMHKKLGLFKGPTIILKAIDCMQGAPIAKVGAAAPAHSSPPLALLSPGSPPLPSPPLLPVLSDPPCPSTTPGPHPLLRPVTIFFASGRTLLLTGTTPLRTFSRSCARSLAATSSSTSSCTAG
jgi:hypothetical protein